MKKTIGLVIIAIIIIGCKKESKDERQAPADKFYFRYRINGQPSDSVTKFLAIKTTGVARFIVLQAISASQQMGMDIRTRDETAVTEGVYVDSAVNHRLSSTYHDRVASTYFTAGTNMHESVRARSRYLDNHFYLTLTEINDTSIRGKFSGDYYYQDDPNGSVLNITAGEFFLPLEEQ